MRLHVAFTPAEAAEARRLRAELQDSLLAGEPDAPRIEGFDRALSDGGHS